MRGILNLLVVAAMAAGCSTPEAQAPVEAPPATATAATAPATTAEPAPAPLPESGSMPGRTFPEMRATLVSRPGAEVMRTESIDARRAKGPTVWIMNSTTCGYCADYADRMKAIESAYIPKGVDVVHVYPVKTESDLEKVEYHAKRGFRGGQILDRDSNIARSLVIDKTPTVFVTDARGVILYRGAIDSSSDNPEGAKPYLAQALDAVLAGKPVPLAETEPEG